MYIMTNTPPRPAFYMRDDIYSEQPYVSAGALYYIIEKKKIYFLIQKREDKKYIEDIGGKSDHRDNSLDDVVCRETLEELNCLAPEHLKPNNNPITKEFLDKVLCTSERILVPDSKYVLYFVQIMSFSRFDLKQYKDTEYNEKGEVMMKRDMRWIERDKLFEMKKEYIHPRISDLMNFLPEC